MIAFLFSKIAFIYSHKKSYDATRNHRSFHKYQRISIKKMKGKKSLFTLFIWNKHKQRNGIKV